MASPKELIKRAKAQFLKESRQMTRELKKALIGKTIKDVEVLKNGGDIYIKLITDKGQIVVGANDLGVWIDRLESSKNRSEKCNRCEWMRMEGLRYEYHKLKCSKCGRKILVEIGLIGVSHNAIVSVTCAECLKKVKLPDIFKKRHAEAAADIERWLEENS